MKELELSERKTLVFTKDEFFKALGIDKSWRVREAATQLKADESVRLVLARES